MNNFCGLSTELLHYIAFALSLLDTTDILSLAFASRHLYNEFLHPEDMITRRYINSLLSIPALLENIEDPEFQHALRIKIEREGVSDVMKILWKVVECGCTSGFMKFVLKLPGIDVNVVDRCGKTPLHFACEKGYLRIVTDLLDHPKIDVTVVNQYERTPLHTASWYEHVDVVTALLACSEIDVNVTNNNNCLLYTSPSPRDRG